MQLSDPYLEMTLSGMKCTIIAHHFEKKLGADRFNLIKLACRSFICIWAIVPYIVLSHINYEFLLNNCFKMELKKANLGPCGNW